MPLNNKWTPIDIHRRSTGNTFNPAGLDFVLISNSNDLGYIQPVGGNETFDKGKGGTLVQFRMFSPMENTSLLFGDKVTQNGKSYTVTWPGEPIGISGEGHHQEILMGVFK